MARQNIESSIHNLYEEDLIYGIYENYLCQTMVEKQ
jgi:hypothetical protein